MPTRHSKTATVGADAPEISLPQADGSRWTLSGALGHGPVVLVFLRGFS
jgi:peroxiredoxin